MRHPELATRLKAKPAVVRGKLTRLGVRRPHRRHRPFGSHRSHRCSPKSRFVYGELHRHAQQTCHGFIERVCCHVLEYGIISHFSLHFAGFTGGTGLSGATGRTGVGLFMSSANHLTCISLTAHCKTSIYVITTFLLICHYSKAHSYLGCRPHRRHWLLGSYWQCR